MQKNITHFVQPYDAVKSWGAKVRVRVAVCVFGKSKLPKAFVSHCTEFLAIFHSQCLSAGTKLEAEQEQQSATAGTTTRPWAVLWPRQGWSRNLEDATIHVDRAVTQIPETGC